MQRFLKGPLALAIRFGLYAILPMLGTAGIGLVVLSPDNSTVCVDVRQLADTTADGVVLILLGGPGWLATLLWSRWAKRNGGTT